MDKDIAIKVDHVSKTFRIPHEKVSSLRGAAVNAFKKSGYEEFKALDDISFEVRKGEFFGIIGRNGSGKSTLLKILAGIYHPDKGKVKVNGLISPFLELGIGFNPELSGRDNVYLNATVLGLSRKEIDEKFDSIVAFSELERFIDQKLKNYSSGMQVRLAFSVSIHANREILLMDEVLAVGDTNFQSKCLTEFNRYKELGKTVILVTHDIATVQRYCDRAMLIRYGNIIKIGKADEIGNEYMIQNMSDEERRIFEEEKNKKNKIKEKEEIKEKKVAEISSVAIYDKNGKQKNAFETGEDLLIRINFKKNKLIKKLNFGVAILTEDSVPLFGITTFNDKIDTKLMTERSYLEVLIDKLPLRTGTYSISVSITGTTESNLIDYGQKVKIFKIFSKDNNGGLIKLSYKWK